MWLSAGALTLASVLLYPKKLGGGAVFSGWVPFSSSVTEKISPEARKVIHIFIPLSLLFSLVHHRKVQGSLDIYRLVKIADEETDDVWSLVPCRYPLVCNNCTYLWNTAGTSTCNVADTPRNHHLITILSSS